MKKLDENTSIIYHGGYCSVETPKIIAGKYPKDFGTGFYCTAFEQQAIRWAKRYETPIVSRFIHERNEDPHVLHFKTMTEEWLDFIVDCRSGKSHDFDIVIGSMANDKIYNYVADFISGIITRKQFWVMAQFKIPTHQIAFCTEKALKCIRFVEYKEVK